MLFSQPLHRPIGRQLAGIPQHDLVLVHANLDRCAAAVILVRNCVQNRFTQRDLRHRIRFHPLYALVRNQRLQILCVQGLHRLVHLREQIAVDLIVIQQIGIALEITDLHKRAGNETFRVRMKQQHGGPLQISTFRQMQLVDQRGIRLFENFGRQAFTTSGTFTEIRQGLRIEVHQRDIRHGHAIPMPSLFAQQKAIKRRSL